VLRSKSPSRRCLARERGQALVEFVVLLPAFLLLVFGVVEFGKAFNYWIDMTHLANEGSRYASVNHWPGCPKDTTVACPETLEEYIESKANTGELRSAIEFAACFPPPGAGQTAGNVGTPVRVTITADIELPVVGGLLSATGFDSEVTIKGRSTARLERPPSRVGAAAC
jgi:hypothetical protein